jgi:predicted nucleic acid-binding protein
MPTGKVRCCWDSCVFINLLTGTGRTDEDMANLRKVERLVDDGEVTIFTPAITIIEVLQCQMTDGQEALLQRSNVYPVSVTMRISEKAREIRNYYRQKNIEIAVPDAIQMATAIQYGATALHTYDGCGKRPRKNDLLKLDSPLIEKYHLRICKPEPPPSPDPEPVGSIMGENMNLFGQPEESEEGS